MSLITTFYNNKNKLSVDSNIDSPFQITFKDEEKNIDLHYVFPVEELMQLVKDHFHRTETCGGTRNDL